MSAPRPRHPAAHWQALIDRFGAGDLGVADFCRHHKVAQSSFVRWRSRLANAVVPAHPAPMFVELPRSPQAAAPRWHIELDLGDGLVLRIAR